MRRPIPWQVLLLAALTVVLGLLLPAAPASAAATPSAGETRVGVSGPATAAAGGVHESITAGQRPVRGPSQLRVVVGNCVAAESGATATNGAVRAGDVGSYSALRSRSVVGDGLALHQMPQAAAGFTSSGQGAAVALSHAEHVLTRTYGARGAQTLKSDAGLSFRDVLARDLWDLRAIGGSNQSVRDVISYYRTNFPELMAR